MSPSPCPAIDSAGFFPIVPRGLTCSPERVISQGLDRRDQSRQNPDGPWVHLLSGPFMDRFFLENV